MWRDKGRWQNFVERLEGAEPRASTWRRHAVGIRWPHAPLPGRILRTARPCASAARCGFRDAASVQLALVDMLNLGSTRLILGSHYSSFSEVASFIRCPWWSEHGGCVPTEHAGVDFGLGANMGEADEAGPSCV